MTMILMTMIFYPFLPVAMMMPMELHPMVDTRLMVTYPQYTVRTRGTKRPGTNGGHRSFHHLLAGVLGLGLGQRVSALCPSLTNGGETDIHSEQFSAVPAVLHCRIYISSPTTSFSTSSLFMVQMSSPNLEATNTGGRRWRLCVANGTALSAHHRRTSSASSISGMTTPRCSLGTFPINEEIPSRTRSSVRHSYRSTSTTTWFALLLKAPRVTKMTSSSFSDTWSASTPCNCACRSPPGARSQLRRRTCQSVALA